MHIISSENRTAAGERENTRKEREENLVDLVRKRKGKSSQSKVQESLHFCPFSGFQEQRISISSLLFTRQPFIASTSISVMFHCLQAPIYVDQEVIPTWYGISRQNLTQVDITFSSNKSMSVAFHLSSACL